MKGKTIFSSFSFQLRPNGIFAFAFVFNFKNSCPWPIIFQEEPRRLFSSLSKHVTYILNIHHPLHSKIQVLFRRYRAKNKKTLNEEELTWKALEEAALEDSADHGIGSNMTEQGYIRRRSSNVYVPILLPETDCPQKHPQRCHRNLGRETGGCNRKCQTRNTSAPKT